MIQFERYASVDVGKVGAASAIRIDGVRVMFKVKKEMSKTMNSAEIRLYNLAPTTKNAFSEIGAAVLLRAGYLQGTGPIDIFSGQVRNVSSTLEGADIVTIVQADDGAGFAASSTEATYKKGSSAKAALTAVIKSTGLPVKFMPEIPDKPFLTGWQYAGRATAALNALCGRLGLEWSVQGGALTFVKAGGVAAKSAAAAQTLAVLLTPDTGLVGSLEKHALRKPIQTPTAAPGPTTPKRYGWQGKCLLNGALVPGDPIALEALSLPQRTIYRIERIEHSGDTHGDDWTTEFLTTETSL